MASYSYILKFIVVGDAKVGKSSIISQLINHTFKNNYDLTIGAGFDTYIASINDKLLKIHIWDIAGNENFRSITRSYYRGSICALIVYDITNRDSFTNISTWLREIRDYGNNHIVILLVGNKSDQFENRVVSMEEGIYFALQNNIFFIETSAKANTNIDQAFMTVISHIYENIERGKYDLNNQLCGIKIINN
ncbi:hypothetical protein SteCoe_6233 [Stentor coeruleus]|uniref:Uncharacterized protein n=1 Tax=Stentor coeruleus TaxID=5963 RepID=A0A1R2CQJ3_9CILI|nr:hypothetical protein SteCoe_6233 [Stentor coeruleus]